MVRGFNTPLSHSLIPLLYFRLQPILARIKQKRSTVVCPSIGSISEKTMEFLGSGGLIFLIIISSTNKISICRGLLWSFYLESFFQMGKSTRKVFH